MASSIFTGLRYYIINSDDDKIVHDLKAQGALKHPILSDSVKFAISDNGEAGEVGEAEDLYAVPVVTSQWVRYSLSKNVLLPFKPFHPNFIKIFKGVTAVISETSLNDAVTLTAHLTIRGADCKTVVDTKTTHLILGRASGFMYERCKTHYPGLIVVSPDWVVECVKAQELLNCEKYDIELLIKPTPPKLPIMPKPVTTSIQLVEQPSQKQLSHGLTPQMGAIGTSVEYYHISPEAVRHVLGIQPPSSTSLENASGNLNSRIVSTNTSLIGFTSGTVPVVSQPQVSTTFQPIHHIPEPKPTKSSGKGKANKHPSEQGLNEEQKHAIVMQNVKNILSQQANWNKDNMQNRSESGQMPGTFLPSGSTPIATGGVQRKPKSPKSPANRSVGQTGGTGSGASMSKGTSGGQKIPKGCTKRAELAEIAVAPVASLGQPQQQQFTAVTVETSGGATQLFPHSTTATVLLATTNPGVSQLPGTSRIPSAPQQNGAVQQTSAFLLQQQQQQQQYQQQALLATQNQFQKSRMASVGTPQQVQVSPLLLQGAQTAPGQPRTATFIVRAPSSQDIQLGQAVTSAENVHALLEGVTSKEGLTPAVAQQVFLQPGQASQQQHQQHLIQLHQQQQHQQKRVPSPSGSGSILSPVFIQGRQPQSQQYKQAPGQMQIQVSGLQTQQQQQQQAIRPQPQRTAHSVRKALPPNHHGQQQYAQLAQVKSSPQQHPHQLGQQQIIIQTSVGVQQVVTAQDLSNAQYIGASGTQMRTVASSTATVQCASSRPPSIVGSPIYTQAQQVLTNNGSASSILYHSSSNPTTVGVPIDAVSAIGTQQERVAYIASIQQQHQTQAVGGRLQPGMVQSQQITQQQTVLNVSNTRSATGVASAQGSIIQTQQTQQPVAIQQGQFYSQSQSQIHSQQQQQRIVVQSPHAPVSAQVSSTPQHCVVSSQLQGQIPQGGGNFIQQQQRPMLPQSQSHQVSSAGHPAQCAHAIVSPQLGPSNRPPLNSPSQIRHMVTAAGVQQRHIAPPPPQYRGGSVVPSRTSATAVSCGYTPVLRAQQQQQQSNANVAAAAVPGNPQPVPTPQSAPAIPPAFQLPVFRGHVGFSCPTSAQDCLIGCVMLIVGYHSFGEAKKSLWKKIIRSYGAEIVTTYDPARVTHIIMDWTLGDPDLYYQALRDRKRLVTIYWLNDVLAKGKLVPPYEIIHLPSTFAPGVSFSFIRSQIISITGFDGIERVKVETIIKQIGASFTDYLDQMNTILVCKRPQGKKYEMATIWGIPCVNLRWLQDIYLGDVSAMAADLSHKYLCFDTSDVSIALETRTPRVQEMMVGWQQGICITPESWEHLAKLRSQLRQEEAEEEAAAIQKRQHQMEDGEGSADSDEEKRCVLPSLTAAEVERAKTGMLRETLLREENERVATHRAAVALAAAQQIPQQVSTTTTYPLLYSVSPAPQYPPCSSFPTNHHLSTPITPAANVFPLVTVPTMHKVAPPPPPPQQQSSFPTAVETEFRAQSASNVHHKTSPLPHKRPHSPFTINYASPPHKRQTNDISLPKSVPPHRVTSPESIQRPASVGPVLSARQPIFEPPTAASVSRMAETLTPALAITSPLISRDDVKSTPSPLNSSEIPLPPPSSQSPLPQLSSPSVPKAETAIDMEVRLVITSVDTEARLAILQLLAQMPKTGIAPYRMVESVNEATHVITERLTRTPKIYMAVALGCPIVTSKWVQACLVRGDWLAETDWLIEDPEAEENLGFRLATSLRTSHERRLFGEPGLFSELEFWFSPMSHHREVCEQLVRACGGRIRERRPTQKMALLPVPRQVIICHEEDSHVASYLMRTKTGNRAVHHEEFILSGVLRQELDFDSYQIQLVSIQFAKLQAAISVANNSNSPASIRTSVGRSQPDLSVSTPSQAQIYMRPPPPPPPAPSCVLLVSGADNQQSSVMYYISSGSAISSAPRALISAPAGSAVVTATASTTAGSTEPRMAQEESLTLHLPESVSAVVVTGAEAVAQSGDVSLNAARVAAADAHFVASATTAITNTGNSTLITDSEILAAGPTFPGQSQMNWASHHPPQQQLPPTQPPSTGTV